MAPSRRMERIYRKWHSHAADPQQSGNGSEESQETAKVQATCECCD